MIRKFVCFAVLASLMACGDGNPFTEEEDTSEDKKVTNHHYGEELNSDLTMNNLRYDRARDELVINNLPFDGADGRYTRNAAKDIGNGFGVYESTRPAGSRIGYYAVFRRAGTGNAQASAVATNRYAAYGFGGATAQRLNSNTALPREGEYVFTGQYAAIRIAGESFQEQYVTGRAYMEIDIKDFDTTGAVEGIISRRKLYDRDGNFVENMTDYVSLATASINFENKSTGSSTATIFDIGGKKEASGKWKGVFAGPNGREMAGILVVESTATAGSADAYRETGAFLTKE